MYVTDVYAQITNQGYVVDYFISCIQKLLRDFI